MRDPAPPATRLKDYAPPAFRIETVELQVEIFEDYALVRSRLAVSRRPGAPPSPLVLDGEELELESVALDARALSSSEYALDEEHLTIAQVPERCTLEILCRIRPRRNTKLMGLYAAESGFFTQCEAQGFRRITYFLDRPDVMAKYTVTIHADREKYPVLLSNGNPVASGTEADGRRWLRWHDPFPKPCYLFAMVAAKLEKLEDSFVTRSGRRVQLAIYVDPGKLDQCGFAMQALKRAMKWDEETFGLEVDLGHYSIVAVGDFNAGAMENKGLNLFNTRYVLARPDTATDADFLAVDRVVAHEYFHNWTGNRVTCRDWFQLSLKEGLTVFRDQEFSADMGSRAVERIGEVRFLRSRQFAEDAGPMAHPVRPDEYVEINNFYTNTVYEKGAEVIRMQHTLLGETRFRRGIDLYFARHDGQAVTCDDFVQAMEDAARADGGPDLAQFRRWYAQAGTPVVRTCGAYDAAAKTYTLDVEQHTPATSGQPHKTALHIPLAVGLVGPDGRDLPLALDGERRDVATTRVLDITQSRQSFTFVGVGVKPVPSLLRGFSAPVKVEFDYDDDALALLAAHDSDSVNRWDAAQRSYVRAILAQAERHMRGEPLELSPALARIATALLADRETDPALIAMALSAPDLDYLAECVTTIDVDALVAARRFVLRELARTVAPRLV